MISNSILPTADNLSAAQKRDVPNGVVCGSPLPTPPSRITVERIRHDARHLSLSDLGQLLRPNQINSLNLRNIARNWQEAIRLRSGPRSNSSQVTQQMSNLSLRPRRDLSTRPTINESLLTVGARIASAQGAARPNILSSDSNINHYSRYLSRLYRCALVRSSQNRQRQQPNGSSPSPASISRNVDAPEVSARTDTTVPASTVPPQRQSLLSREQRQAITDYTRLQQRLNDSVQSLFVAFNEMFVRGRIVSPNTNLQDFTGIVTEDLADKLCEWLVREHRRHTLIQSIFVYSACNPMEKVLQFLRQCGVQLQTNNRVTKIRRHQSLNLLMILTYLLHAAGYNNTYFIPE